MNILGASARLDHVGVAVHDADRALVYFTEVLGLRVVHDEVAPEPGSRLVHLAAGDVSVQLVQPLRENAVSDFLRTRGEGLHHVAFRVDGLDHLVDAAGLDVPVFTGGQGCRACFLPDTPDGLAVELVDRGAAPVPKPFPPTTRSTDDQH